jgi:hypothetical protein
MPLKKQLKKQPKNRQPHRVTDVLSEAESENPRERQAPANTNKTRDIILSPRNQRAEEDQEQEQEYVAGRNFEVG